MLKFGFKQNDYTNDFAKSMKPDNEPIRSEEDSNVLYIEDSNHIERIKNGDFSDIKYWYDNEIADENCLVTLKMIYERLRDDLEWVERDINGDTVNELIWREQKGMQRLKAVFAFENNEVKLVYLHKGDAHFYDFVSDSGYYISYDFWYGITRSNSFRFYTLDQNFNKKFIYGLIILDVYDFSELEDEWFDNNPYIKENGTGIYYQEFYLDSNGNPDNFEYISAEYFFRKFEETTGFSFKERTDFFPS